MKILRVITVLLSGILLVGCPTVQPTPPTPIRVAGPYNHPGSQMIFPENVGRFQRVQITQFAAAEKDVGVGYNLNDPTTPVAATVYIYPAPRVVSIGSPPDVVETARRHVFQGHLNALKSEIMRGHPDARLISDEDFTLTQAEQSFTGRKVTFEFDYTFGTQPQDSISELLLFQRGTWLIKYRITFPKAISAEVQDTITDFLKGLTWSEK